MDQTSRTIHHRPLACGAFARAGKRRAKHRAARRAVGAAGRGAENHPRLARRRPRGTPCVVAALGIRLLELFVDPAIFESLPRVQQKLFRTADVLLTGAVLGGGSDALHQLVSVFTNFMESAARRVKG